MLGGVQGHAPAPWAGAGVSLCFPLLDQEWSHWVILELGGCESSQLLPSRAWQAPQSADMTENDTGVTCCHFMQGFAERCEIFWVLSNSLLPPFIVCAMRVTSVWQCSKFRGKHLHSSAINSFSCLSCTEQDFCAWGDSEALNMQSALTGVPAGSCHLGNALCHRSCWPSILSLWAGPGHSSPSTAEIGICSTLFMGLKGYYDNKFY